MGTNLEETIRMPSPVRLIEYSSEKNPLFQEALSKIKNPKEKEAFLSIFRKYLMDAYKNNPKMNRLMKIHDLTDKIVYAPKINEYDERNVVDGQLYAEPGRTYHYTNNFLGYERKKEGILKKLYNTTKELTLETLPGIAGIGGLYGAKKWYTKELAKDAVEESLKERLKETAKNKFSKAFEDMRWWEFLDPYFGPIKISNRLSKGLGNAAVAVSKEATKEVEGDFLRGIVGSALTPAKYLIGGYFLYKTIKYFMRKYKERKELRNLNRGVWLQNQMLAQRV